MPNYCDYQMRIKGKPENVDSFVRLLQADYDEVPKHFWRVFTADIYYEASDNDHKVVDVCGDCAWSVYTCMCEGDVGTYYADTPEQSTSLKEQSGLLNLVIEVYSSEPGVGFQEHYLYKDGEELVNDCVDYSEMYFEDEEDFNEQKRQGFCGEYTWDDVDSAGFIKTGGFDSWGCFEI